MRVKWEERDFHFGNVVQREGFVVAFCSEASDRRRDDYNVIRAVVKEGNKLYSVDIGKLEIIE